MIPNNLKIGDTFTDNGLTYKVIAIPEEGEGIYISKLVEKEEVVEEVKVEEVKEEVAEVETKAEVEAPKRGRKRKEV